MKTLDMLGSPTFNEARAHAEPLLVEASGRVLRFCLKARQSVREHCAPHSPVHIVVLRGRGVFSGADQAEHTLGPGGLAVFEAGELHRVRALDEELIFVALLRPVDPAALRASSRRPRAQPEEDAYLTWQM